MRSVLKTTDKQETQWGGHADGYSGCLYDTVFLAGGLRRCGEVVGRFLGSVLAIMRLDRLQGQTSHLFPATFAELSRALQRSLLGREQKVMYLRCCPGHGAGETIPSYQGYCTQIISAFPSGRSPSQSPALLTAQTPSTISGIHTVGL